MERLSGADASFVCGETPSGHMHAGMLVVLDPSTAPDGFDVHRLRAELDLDSRKAMRSGSPGPS